MKRALAAALLVALCGIATAKLPALTDEQKAKAAEAKAKADDAAKKEGELLGKYQDKTATHWAAKMKAAGKEFKPTAIAGAAPAAASAPAAAATGASKPAAKDAPKKKA